MLTDLVTETRDADLPGLLGAVDDHLADALDAFATGVYCLGVDGRPWTSRLRGLPGAFYVAYEMAGRQVDPVHDRVVASLEPASDTSVLGASAWQRSRLFQEVSAPFGLGHILEAPVVAADGRVVASLHAARGPGDPSFATRDLLRAATLAGWLVARLPHGPTPLTADARTRLRLTPRQREVADLVAEGCTDGQVAARLGVTVHAVKQLLKRLYARHGLSCRAELAAAVTRQADDDGASQGSSPEDGWQLT